MAGIAVGDGARAGPAVEDLGRRRAAGIYGAVITAAILDTAGASDLTAANAGLVVAIVLLAVHGWLAGRAARLEGGKLVIATSIAAGLGLVMILLKDLVLVHLH